MEKENSLTILQADILDPEELKEEIKSVERLLFDLKRKLYIAEHKGEKSKEMEKLLKEENEWKREREEWIKRSVSSCFSSEVFINLLNTNFNKENSEFISKLIDEINSDE